MNSEYVCPNMTDSVMLQTIPIYGNVHRKYRTNMRLKVSQRGEAWDFVGTSFLDMSHTPATGACSLTS